MKLMLNGIIFLFLASILLLTTMQAKVLGQSYAPEKELDLYIENVIKKYTKLKDFSVKTKLKFSTGKEKKVPYLHAANRRILNLQNAEKILSAASEVSITIFASEKIIKKFDNSIRAILDSVLDLKKWPKAIILVPIKSLSKVTSNLDENLKSQKISTKFLQNYYLLKQHCEKKNVKNKISNCRIELRYLPIYKQVVESMDTEAGEIFIHSIGKGHDLIRNYLNENVVTFATFFHLKSEIQEEISFVNDSNKAKWKKLLRTSKFKMITLIRDYQKQDNLKSILQEIEKQDTVKNTEGKAA